MPLLTACVSTAAAILINHSYYAKLLTVRKLTNNKGRKTPGVDKVLWNTPAQKMNAVLSLADK